MASSRVVLETVLAVLAVMGVGALARRAGIVSGEGGKAMSRLVADVTFPALCLDGLAHADGETLHAGGSVAALGFLTLALAAGASWLVVRVAGLGEREGPTARFSIAIGNWIFLPLPVAEALFGARGTTVVVLNNVGAQLFLWTAGLVLLRGGGLDLRAARAIVRSPGLWATLIGLVLALARPTLPSTLGPLDVAIDAGATAVHWVASLTIPLVSVAIGVQLAETREPAPARSVAAIAIGRLLVAPLVVSAAIELALRAGIFTLPPEARMTEHLIAAMPVSLSAAALVERYEGAVPLVSRAILVTTLLSVASAPLWMWLIERLA